MSFPSVKKRRLELGLRQIDVANRGRISVVTVRLAEQGYHGIGTDAKKKIARALTSSVKELFPEAADGTPLVPGR